MDFSDQPARIFVEDNGCSVIHFGATYPSDKVTISGSNATDVVLSQLPRKEYCNVIISGCRDNKNDELMIVRIQRC
jgi:hypothetical protein